MHVHGMLALAACVVLVASVHADIIGGCDTDEPSCSAIEFSYDDTIPSLLFPKLVATDGDVYVAYNYILTTVSFPALTKVGDELRVGFNNVLTTVSFPALTKVGGKLNLYFNHYLVTVSFPALTKVGGKLYVTYNDVLTTVSFPALTKVGDYLEVKYNAVLTTFEACALRSVEGYVTVTSVADDGWTLLTISSDADIKKNTAYTVDDVTAPCAPTTMAPAVDSTSFQSDDAKCDGLYEEAEAAATAACTSKPCKTVAYLNERVQYWQGEYAKVVLDNGEHHDRAKSHYINRIPFFCNKFTKGMSGTAALGLGKAATTSAVGSVRSLGGVFGVGIVLLAAATFRHKTTKPPTVAVANYGSATM